MTLNFGRLAIIATAVIALVGNTYSQNFTDPGFESYSVNSGGFLKPISGPWIFANDAGVVEPYASNSSTGTLYTWSATFTALEGQQYVSTYGGDSLRQTVSFDSAGDYRVSVCAAAPDGSVTIPPLGSFPLVNGEFTFALGSTAIGVTNVVPRGSSWNSYGANFNISHPGNYTLQIWNTKTASYFINYDAFAIQAVPEPTAFQLVLVPGLIVTLLKRRGRKPTRQ